MNKIKIAFITCDRYAWIMPTCIKYFLRAWPLDCRYQLEFVGNTVMPEEAHQVGKVVLLGEDKGWCANLLAYLEGTDDTPFIMALDDYILGDADARLIRRAVEVIRRDDIGLVRLYPCPGPTLDWEGDPDIGELDKHLPQPNYFISTQIAIWKPQVIRDIAQPDWTAWDFELQGSKKAETYMRYKFLSVYRGKGAIGYREYLHRGNPIPETVRWIEEHP